MQRLFVLDQTRGYLPTLLLAAAAYAQPETDVLLADPGREAQVIRTAVERFVPAEVLAMGDLPKGALPAGYGPAVRSLPVALPQVLAYLVDEVINAARGVVLFPAHSPSWAIKGAALAARLGYIAWPVEEALGMALAGPPGLEILVVGEAPGNLQDVLQGRDWVHLPGDRAVAAYLQQQGVPVDYVVLVNSADLTPPQYHEEGLAGYWTPALSLLAPALASYRAALVVDARTPRPDARQLEATVNQKVADVGLRPRYLAVLGSPGSVPFVCEPQVEFRALAEEPIRDIHLRLDGDLFFDCAEGRLFARQAGRVSLQILTTKHYASLEGEWKQRALVAAHPHVSAKVAYAVEEACAKVQLVPALRHAGLQVQELYRKECSPPRLTPELARAGLFFYGGWGSPFGLDTHGRPLYPEELPDLPPLVAYASAGSTNRPKPFHVSADGGHSYQDQSLPPDQVLGPAFIEKGAVAFVGGLTAEDVLWSTPMSAVFFHALVLAGQPVGEAVRAARNYALLYGQVLSQQDPVAFRRARPALAETVGQQLLLGDPAFAPYPGAPGLAVTPRTSGSAPELTVSVEIPPESWRREPVPVDPGPLSLEHHRFRTLELWAPALGGVANNGDGYPVAPAEGGVSERGIVGAMLHLWADLPPGRVPERVELAAAEVLDAQCLACGEDRPAPRDPVAALSCFRLQFGHDRIQYDYTRGWAFGLEERPEGLRAHWLAPTVVANEATRRIMRVRRLDFRVHLGPAVHQAGRLELPGSGKLPEHVLLTFGRPLPALPGARPGDEPRLLPLCQVRAAADGSFGAWLPARGDLAVRVSRPFPTYDACYQAPASYKPWTYTGLQAGDGPLFVRLAPTETGTIVGTVVDQLTGRALEKATVRVFTGGAGREGAIFNTGYVAQVQTDHIGRFRVDVPYGEYVVAAQTRQEHKYFPRRRLVYVHRGHTASVVLSLAPGGTVRGRVTFKGDFRAKTGSVRIVPAHLPAHQQVEAGFIHQDGLYEALAPTNTPFVLVVEQEGFCQFRDDNGGPGYWLEPGGELVRDCELEPDPEG